MIQRKMHPELQKIDTYFHKTNANVLAIPSAAIFYFPISRTLTVLPQLAYLVMLLIPQLTHTARCVYQEQNKI